MNAHRRFQLAATAAALFAGACDSPAPKEVPASDDTPKKEAPASTKAHTDSPPKMPGALKDGEVKCLGIHECKGKSACHVIGGHACAGQNDCKGKGWIVVPEADCESKGGQVLKS